MSTLFTWIESTSVAQAVASSAAITAWLSALHVVGFTLVTSGALVAGLRTVGAVLRQRLAADVVRPASNVILIGLAISLPTGALLFSARAADVSTNGIFQLKMLLLAAAAVFHFTIVRRLAASTAAGGKSALAAGAIGLALWLGLALAACAFILLE